MSAPENYWSLPDRVPYGPRRRDHDCFLRGYGAASPGWGMIRCQLDQATDSAHAMSARPTPLPEFEDPPISEVALSILFSPLVNWRSAHAGLYWSRINGQYPRTETHPPLPMQIEQFDPDFIQRPMIQFEVVNPDISRFWFVADPPTKLIQVQRDRFVINWRKVKGDEIYPRYMAEMRPRFDREWKDFVAFVSQQHIGTIEVRQCEITYINDLLQGQGWQTFPESMSLFAPWWKNGTDGFLPRPETLGLSGSFRILEDRGRLHFNAMHVRRQFDNRESIRLELVARGKPASDAHDAVLAWMDMGHEWIVRGFADLTSNQAHKLWKRKS
jgi:uncharacterized protein (TIGR04255 family)